MVEFEVSADHEMLRQIATHPDIWPHISDDFSPDRKDFRIVVNPLILYLVPKFEGHPIGFWMFCRHSPVLWEIHTAILPQYRGSIAYAAAKEMLVWLWENTPCCRLITSVPSDNQKALRYAIAAGMTAYGVNSKSYKKNGVLIDQTMLGISRPCH